MEQWKVLVVEDEPITQEQICQLIDDDSELKLVSACASIEEALSAIPIGSPDLLLLDIQLSDGTSFEILKELSADRPELIFITAYHEFAIKAFEEHAIDYLLKPFDPDRFRTAIGRAKTRLRSDSTSDALDTLRSLFSGEGVHNSSESQEHITIKVDGRTLIRPCKEIQHIEAAKSGVSIHIGGEVYVKRDSLSHMEDVLSEREFVRIHRSTIVNLNAIEEIQPWFHGDYVVILKDQTRLKLSRRYKAALEERLGSKI